MNTTAHTLISSSIAALLALATIVSVVIAGIASNAAIMSFSLFVAWGVIETLIQSYAGPTGVLRGPARPARTAPRQGGTIVPRAFATEPRKVA